MKRGAAFEQAACQYLTERGLVLLARNYRTRYGEIDLVMRDGATLVFVEVKYRSTSAYGSPLEAVDFSKQNRIKRTALFYLAETNCCYDVVRFDVVGITKIGENVKYRWVKGAFQ
ncbi:MAG: YraN family protein [Firmicutes bacterium]|jgi:putative endonuclease|nr:YraN family protein [Bacillota bacterium]